MQNKSSRPTPTSAQIATTQLITEWYLRHYYRTQEDVGVPQMFCDPSRVGHFAVCQRQLSRGEDEALFKLFVTMIMFQRRSDLQIMRVLRGISHADVEEMTNRQRLSELSAKSGCDATGSLRALLDTCDLAKDLRSKAGVCHTKPELRCHLKRHTELLKRYGHFGKVPTSAALMLKNTGVDSLNSLRYRVEQETDCVSERANTLLKRISESWRVSDKIASMFLSAITNKDLSGKLAPWSSGIDTHQFIVIDSNVDLFLKAVGYSGPSTYSGRRNFIWALSEHVQLNLYNSDLSSYNPRIVQQALYMFMSESNRRESPQDCSHFNSRCAVCAVHLSSICPRRLELA